MDRKSQVISDAHTDLPVFRVKDLSFSYSDRRQALSGVCLDLQEGERVALMGSNGSGKTTLLKQLCGLLEPTVGSVDFRGRRLTGAYLERMRLEIGVLFQDPDDQLFGHTLLDDVSFGPRNQGLSRSQADDAARQALMRVGLLDLAYKHPHHLSLGQKKRAALAGLLAMTPRVLLLDEPNVNLDSTQEQALLDILASFSGTLLCTGHGFGFLRKLCNRLVVLEHGHIHEDNPIKGQWARSASVIEEGHFAPFHKERVGTRRYGSPVGQHPSQSTRWDAGAFPVIALYDYSYQYPDGTEALIDIHATVAAGERIALVGENGAGKTTLLSCLVGLIRGRGEYRFAGNPVTAYQVRHLWRKVGMVFQDTADQLFCPSVEEEVAFGLRRLGCQRAELHRRIESALATVQLSGFEARVPSTLSGGERRRLAIAAVLAMEPEVLILDEPAAGLDARGREALLAVLAPMRVTLILATHDMDFIGAMTHRTWVMHRGRILDDLPSAAFLRDPRYSILNGSAFRRRLAEVADRHRLDHEIKPSDNAGDPGKRPSRLQEQDQRSVTNF